MIYVHWYDANSERMVRTSGEHEAIYVDYSASRVLYQACLSIAEVSSQVTIPIRMLLAIYQSIPRCCKRLKAIVKLRNISDSLLLKNSFHS